jgi:hypothetical protein
MRSIHQLKFWLNPTAHLFLVPLGSALKKVHMFGMDCQQDLKSESHNMPSNICKTKILSSKPWIKSSAIWMSCSQFVLNDPVMESTSHPASSIQKMST